MIEGKLELPARVRKQAPTTKDQYEESCSRTGMQGGDADSERASLKHTTLQSWLAEASL